MDSQAISEWLASLSVMEQVRAVALLYSRLTVSTRQVFLTSVENGKERSIIHLLQGVNELHHTVANQVVGYSFDEDGYPPQLFAQQLFDIANQYGIRELLAQAVDSVRSQNLSPKG
jgi:intein-encoded DNA endonuclease-like protein